MKKNRNKKTIGANFWKKLSIETRWFIVIAFVFGFTFIAATPAGGGSDEYTHYARSWQITTGKIFAEKNMQQPQVYGGWLPYNLFSVNYERPGDVTLTWVGIPNTAAYSPVAYIPSLLAVSLARLFNANTYTIFYLARLFDLLFFIIGIAFALNALRGTRAQWLVFVVALLPSTLFQASTISADTVTNVCTFLLSALLIKSLFLNKKLSRLESIMFVVCAATIPILKQSYALLSLLIFLVPLANFAIRCPRLAQILAVSVGFALFICWSVATRDVADYSGLIRRDVTSWTSPSGQIQFLLHHPFNIIQIALVTLFNNGYQYVQGIFGNLGMKIVTLPAACMVLCILMLGLSAFVFEKNKLARRYPLIVLADVLIGAVMVFAILYIAFTPVSLNIVQGVHGRYFIPFIILGLSAVSALMYQFKPDGISTEWYEKLPKLFIGGTIISLSLTAFKFIYLWTQIFFKA